MGSFMGVWGGDKENSVYMYSDLNNLHPDKKGFCSVK